MCLPYQDHCTLRKGVDEDATPFGHALSARGENKLSLSE